VDSKFLLICEAQHVEYLIEIGSEMIESRFDLTTFGSDTILNYQLSQKFKLIEICKFNHLTITLIWRLSMLAEFATKLLTI
jgi:hypothetical protein